jgi:hypothetical protein
VFLPGLVSDLLTPPVAAAVPAAIPLPLADRRGRWRLPRRLGPPWPPRW